MNTLKQSLTKSRPQPNIRDEWIVWKQDEQWLAENIWWRNTPAVRFDRQGNHVGACYDAFTDMIDAKKLTPTQINHAWQALRNSNEFREVSA